MDDNDPDARLDHGRFDQVALREFLDVDDRPAAVYDTRQKCIVYKNTAFNALMQSSPQVLPQFTQPTFVDWLLDFVRSDTCIDFAVNGETWRPTLLMKRWIILSAHKSRPSATPPTPPIQAPTDHTMGEPGVTPTSSQASMEPSQIFTKPLDWTKYPVGGLSTHMLSIKKFPWENTSVGSIDSWSDIFRSIVIAMNANSEPRIMLWGPERTMIYNEACAPLFGQKHPLALGGKAEDIWSEAWPALVGFISAAETECKATRIANMPLTMHRHGFDEETFWIANFIPVMGSNGKTAGVLDEFTETTSQVIQDRRRDVTIRTSEIVSRANTLEELWNGFLEGLQSAGSDIPYAGIYVPTDSSHANPTGTNTPSGPLHRFMLHGTIGVDKSSGVLPSLVDLGDESSGNTEFVKACRQAWKTGDVISLALEDDTMPSHMAVAIPDRCAGYSTKNAWLVPISDVIGDNQLAFAVIALTPRRPSGANATAFVRSLTDVLTRSASVIFLPDEQRRARQHFEELGTSFAQRLAATNLEVEKLEARYEKLINQVPVGM